MRSDSRGFSLVELLIVIAIIALMASLMGPSLDSALRGTAMTQSADKVSGLLSLARQTAIAKGQTVEVRFYKFKDPEIPGDPGAYHALQAFAIDDAGNASPLLKPVALPSSIIISDVDAISSITTLPVQPPAGMKIPRVGTAYTYIAFRFRRSGAPDLNPGGAPWCLTLLADKDAKAAQLPKNYTTFVIDPYSGTLKTYRPTI
jgi:uncharacterized protein (TIGR02596 family)